ncbi:MAG: ATP-binding cassette domain-containing protein [Phycisphaerales bacterium]|mgnify:CR=1 FL=1|nr:ATP-binding cassette domain-containing protein [Phycisphaerales bacterium]
MSAVIELTGVRFRHAGGADGTPAFELNIDELSVRAGEVAACIGPSGSGKTTMLDVIAGINHPESGCVVVAGHDMTGLDLAGRRWVRLREVGLVFQTLALVEYLSAFENILLPYFVEPALNRDRKATDRARMLADQLEIGHLLKRRPKRLSQGERQRVAICRALVTAPRVLLCDEPTGNLDPARKDRTIDLLLEAARSSEAAVLMATHDHSLLPRFDTVIDMASLSRSAS